MGPFQGGIWDANPFGGRRGGYQPRQPQRGDYAEQDPYDDYDSPPMMGGNSYSYSSYQDSDGNMHQEGYGPNGPYRHTMGGAQGPPGMGMNGGMPPRGPSQGRAPLGSLLGGRSTSRPGAFRSSFWTGPNPFRVNDANGRVNGRADGRHGPRPDAAFEIEADPAPMRQDRGLSQEAAEDMAWFMQERTQPVGDGGSAPPNAECPICLEPPKDGVWQDSEQFQQLANGQNAGGRAPHQGPPPTGGMPGEPPMVYGRGPSPPQDNFGGPGQRIGYMYPDQRW
ncbi:hypothetical protein ACET3X_003348 [Alternaria dauci]|uniref:Uncharacterized protein n=1 Tax=Alternaria dauci TaxID=48095 RepID=A0ABR3UV67_9PLEO